MSKRRNQAESWPVTRIIQGHEALVYTTEKAATRAMRRFLKRCPVHPDCKVEVVSSTQSVVRWMIRVTGRDNRSSFWSR